MKRLVLGATGAAALVVAGAGAASAHVTVSPGEAEAGSYAVLTFAVPHGCDGSATTEVAIQIPEQIPSVTPTVNSNWDVEKVTAPQEDGPARVEQVIYTAETPLPDGMRDTFELSMLMPDSPGRTLAFPVVQTCEQGVTEWSELPTEGADPHSLDTPAPLVTLTAPESDNAHEVPASSTDDVNEASKTSAGTDQTGDASDAGAGGGSDNGLAVAGLTTGILGIVVGTTALARTRQQT